MTPESEVQALGRDQYYHMVKMHKFFEILYLYSCIFLKRTEFMNTMSIKPSTYVVNLIAPGSGGQNLG